MIKNSRIDVNITYRNVTYYRSKNYVCNNGETLDIDVNDLPQNSHVKVIAVCEICSDEKQLRYHKYLENKKRQGFYSCKKCSSIKRKNTMLEKYGVENPQHIKEIKDKTKQTNLKKYGVTCTLLDKDVKEKIKKTNLEKYGVEEILSSYEIREKIKKTNLEKYGKEWYTQTESYYLLTYKRWEKDILFKLSEYNITDYILNTDRTIDVKCDCGKDHYFNINSKNLYQRYKIQKTILCTVCNTLDYKISGKELEIVNFIKENYNYEIITSDKEILDGKELDIYLPDLNLAFEFNGLYWHSELYKDKDYHLNKTNNCLKKGVQLIHIWEDEWFNQKEIVKSRILNMIGKSDKIYARKTIIKEIIDNKLIRNFLNDNHLQGFVGSFVKIGLYYEDELVSLMTFGKKRKLMGSKSIEGEYELLRFCNKLNINVVGGASKLFKYFIRNYNPGEIITYADRSWSKGNLYEKLEFKFVHNTKPNYHYFDGKNLKRLYRYNFRKDVLVREGYDPNKSEHEIMLERGIYRIYNSGNIKYSLNF